MVDSDWVADYLKGREAATTVLTELFPAGLAISIITFAEIYEGIYYGHDPQRHEQVFRRFIQGVSILDLTRTVARRYARLRGELRQLGQVIDQPDLFIAATAIEYNLELLTRNLRDFERIPGLLLARP
ncbi:MAG TPA: type II toxin-antitoxin system VapC family toxin [Thermomicrobiaceae bacterium]|nr:type II toxin-antitoxin system VapC family toxin [Thermomicrobiaceae bacterium]